MRYFHCVAVPLECEGGGKVKEEDVIQGIMQVASDLPYEEAIKGAQAAFDVVVERRAKGREFTKMMVEIAGPIAAPNTSFHHAA